MKKIVHIIFTLELGGAENLLVDIANKQSAQAKVAVMIINDKVDSALLKKFNGHIKVVKVGRSKGSRNIIHLMKIWFWLFRYQPTVIHCHQHNLINMLPFWKKRTVLTVHDVNIPTKNLAKYKRVYAISRAVYNDLLQRCGLQTLVIHNGIPIENIQQKESHFFHTAQSFKIVQVSRLMHEKKGQHFAILAISKLREEGYSNIKLFFIGNGASLPHLKQLVRDEHLENQVFFLGEKDRKWIYDNLHTYDLLIQPSIYEGFGLTILEGVSAGLPVIASDIDGPAEILQEIPSGFLFRAGDVNDLVRVLKKVLHLHQKEELSKLCKTSLQVVKNSFSVTQTADKYLHSYSA